MLKCQLHSHSSGDADDYIPHTPKQLISKAKELNYDVLSITCHRKVIFSKDLKKYAEKKGILLIPGCEIEIKKKHVLVINCTKDVTQIKSFEDLKKYKKTNPNCLIIAPHPFFPTKECLKKDLIDNIDLFDAIEQSWAYTKTKNYNTPAIEMAKRWKKPIVATADCHMLKDLNIGYTNIDALKNTNAIVQAIKENKIQNTTQAASYFKILNFFITQNLRNFFHKSHN